MLRHKWMAKYSSYLFLSLHWHCFHLYFHLEEIADIVGSNFRNKKRYLEHLILL